MGTKYECLKLSHWRGVSGIFYWAAPFSGAACLSISSLKKRTESNARLVMRVEKIAVITVQFSSGQVRVALPTPPARGTYSLRLDCCVLRAAWMFQGESALVQCGADG